MTEPVKGEIIGEPRRKEDISLLMLPYKAESYKYLLYGIFTLFLAIFYFTYAITGLSLGIGLAITIFGLPLLGVFFYSIPYMLKLQCNILNGLVGLQFDYHVETHLSGSYIDKLKQLLTDPLRYRALVYMLIYLPIGIFVFTFVVSLFSVGIAFILSPIFYYIVEPMFEDTEFNNTVYDFMLDYVPEPIVSVLLIIVGYVVLNLLFIIIRKFVDIEVGLLHWVFSKPSTLSTEHTE